MPKLEISFPWCWSPCLLFPGVLVTVLRPTEPGWVCLHQKPVYCRGNVSTPSLPPEDREDEDLAGTDTAPATQRALGKYL